MELSKDILKLAILFSFSRFILKKSFPEIIINGVSHLNVVFLVLI